MSELKLFGHGLIEGVSISGPRGRAAAVRNEDGDIIYRIKKETRPKDGTGVFKAGRDLWRSLVWSARQVGDTGDDALGPFAVIGSVLGSLILAALVFVFIPAVAANFAARYLPQNLSYLIEGLLRAAFLLLFLLRLGRYNDVKRLKGYNAAAHQAVAAYEAQAELSPDGLSRFPLRDRRDGLAIVLTAALVLTVVFPLFNGLSVLPRIGIKLAMALLALLIGQAVWSRSCRKPEDGLCRILLAPTALMQRLLVRRPDPSEQEVAIAAVLAVPDIGKVRVDAARRTSLAPAPGTDRAPLSSAAAAAAYMEALRQSGRLPAAVLTKAAEAAQAATAAQAAIAVRPEPEAKAAPETEPAPAEEPAPKAEPAPVAETAPAEEPAPQAEPAPVAEAAPVEEPAPANRPPKKDKEKKGFFRRHDKKAADKAAAAAAVAAAAVGAAVPESPAEAEAAAPAADTSEADKAAPAPDRRQAAASLMDVVLADLLGRKEEEPADPRLEEILHTRSEELAEDGAAKAEEIEEIIEDNAEAPESAEAMESPEALESAEDEAEEVAEATAAAEAEDSGSDSRSGKLGRKTAAAAGALAAALAAGGREVGEGASRLADALGRGVKTVRRGQDGEPVPEGKTSGPAPTCDPDLEQTIVLDREEAAALTAAITAEQAENKAAVKAAAAEDAAARAAAAEEEAARAAAQAEALAKAQAEAEAEANAARAQARAAAEARRKIKAEREARHEARVKAREEARAAKNAKEGGAAVTAAAAPTAEEEAEKEAIREARAAAEAQLREEAELRQRVEAEAEQLAVARDAAEEAGRMSLQEPAGPEPAAAVTEEPGEAAAPAVKHRRRPRSGYRDGKYVESRPRPSQESSSRMQRIAQNIGLKVDRIYGDVEYYDPDDADTD